MRGKSRLKPNNTDTLGRKRKSADFLISCGHRQDKNDTIISNILTERHTFLTDSVVVVFVFTSTVDSYGHVAMDNQANKTIHEQV